MDRRTTGKMIISATLAVYAVASIMLFGERVAVPVAAGMVLGFHGGACLARLPIARRMYKDTFMMGVLSFMIGHFCYIAAFLLALGGARPGVWFYAALAVYAAVAVAVWGFSMRGAKDIAPAVRFGSLAYALVIGVMASFAAALWSARGGVFWIPALGGLLFVVSDSFIAAGDFGGVCIPHKDNLIWATYVPAQLCIVLLPVLMMNAHYGP